MSLQKRCSQMSKLSLSSVNTIEKKIRDAKLFQYIASDESDAIIEALKQISIRSGLAIYVWSSGSGLMNIKSGQTPLPGTRSVLEALKYANKNHYFSVYVFPGIKPLDLLELKSTMPSAKTLLKVNKNTRFLFLTKEDIQFNFLTVNAEEIELANKNNNKYKLRDGKWVISDA